MDGSSGPFCEAILQAGVRVQRQRRATLSLLRKVEIKVAEKWAVAEPSQRLEIHGSIEWDHPSIGYQEFHYIEGKTDFAELAHARTFGFLHEVEALKRMGLARGGSFDNAVVLDHALVLNPGGLRSPDEFVRHKVLDALGDFKLAGMQLQGHFRLHRAGHDLHSQLLTAIFKDADNFEIIGDQSHEQVRIVRPAMAAVWKRAGGCLKFGHPRPPGSRKTPGGRGTSLAKPPGLTRCLCSRTNGFPPLSKKSRSTAKLRRTPAES